MNGYTGLSDLSVVVNEACVNSGAACSNLSVKFLCQLEQHVEAFLAAYAVASGNNDGRAFKVVLSLLNMAVDNLYDIVGWGNILRNVGINHLALVVLVENLALHHALAHCSHLRTVVRVDDSGNDVSAESGAYLIQEVLIVLACLLVVVVANLELCAVCGESACER